jgi:hypothetical protein
MAVLKVNHLTGLGRSSIGEEVHYAPVVLMRVSGEGARMGRSGSSQRSSKRFRPRRTRFARFSGASPPEIRSTGRGAIRLTDSTGGIGGPVSDRMSATL